MTPEDYDSLECRMVSQLNQSFSGNLDDGSYTSTPLPEDQYNSLENGMTQQSGQTFQAKFDNVFHVLYYKLIDHEDNKIKVRANYKRIFPVEDNLTTKECIINVGIYDEDTDLIPIINQLFQHCVFTHKW